MSHRFFSFAVSLVTLSGPVTAARADAQWIGTWASAAQPAPPAQADKFRDQTIRLIVHVSAGGTSVRIRLSNIYGDRPLAIDGAHVARRATGADIDPATDRPLHFRDRSSVSIAAGAEAWSDAVQLDVPALSDLAISLHLGDETLATTAHALALQTSYVSQPGDHTAAPAFPVLKSISTWPFLTGVDVATSRHGAAIVAFGSSHTDGDGSTGDANRRWPDLLAARLGRSGQALGMLNEGIIGNRLLNDSPRSAASPFGALLGESGMRRFERDVLSQSGVKYVVMGLGVNDILFPSLPFTPPSETVTAGDLIAGYRDLIACAHANGIGAIGTTIPPFEGAKFEGFGMDLELFTADRERTRAALNEWIRHGGAFDAVVDFDAVLRDPHHPTRLSPAFAVEDGLHVNDAGNAAQADAFPLEIFLIRPPTARCRPASGSCRCRDTGSARRTRAPRSSPAR
jgi:lysophospholipase L1-like esterase